MKTYLIFSLVFLLFLSAACTPVPAALPTSTLPVPEAWQTYTNPVGFSIRYPATWSEEELSQQPGETFQTVVVQGSEGEVNLHWGVGFGGACPQGYTTVQVAEGELSACYARNADGTELWTQINKQLEATSFSAEARTNNADPASHDLVLEVLSTLSFPPGETSQALSAPTTAPLTARMLTSPNALVGPSPSSFSWSPVGALLAYLEPQDEVDMLWLYDATSGDKRLLLDSTQAPGNLDVASAEWSPGADRILLTGDEALWLLDVATGDLMSLAEGGSPKTSVMFTPDGTRVSYVQDNDLYLVGIDDGQVQRLTTDGGETVFNGALDWVYNEELATRAAQPAYAWSPDSNWLIYLQLDETGVQLDPTTDYRPVPAAVSYTHYPTAGTANPVASLHALTPGALAPPLELPLSEDAEYVLPLFTWTPDSNHALYMTVNRDHTELALNMWTPQSGETRTLITETASDWINEDRYAAPIFLGDGGQFLWLSERDGFMHLYLYAADGTLVRQLTQGDWMIDSSAWNLLTPGRPVHVDPAGTWAYFTTIRTSPLERQIDRVNIGDGQLEQVSQQPGFHLSALSADGQYLVDQVSDVDTPPVTQMVKTDGSGTAVLDEAAGPALDLPQVTREFLTVQAADGTDLYAQLVKPEGFDPAQQYPVVVHWYGGPGLQMVSNRYGTTNIFNIIERDVLYTQEGFLVWRLDNRGGFGRGHAFESPVFGELGKVALEDQLAGIDYLQTLPYVDASRIGTDGKSFGGYMTLYALLHAPEVFRCGVAGAPPTDWSYYDTIYTERYMRTPDQNPEGYSATNLIDVAGQMQARPLLIHGLQDTNVHLQNTVNFIQALEANDKLFDFIPLPTLSHSFTGDGLVAALSASADYLERCLGASSAAPVSAVAADTSTAPVGGGAGQLVFDSSRGGDGQDLYVMASDGTGVRRLTYSEAGSYSYDGSWSPDGTRVAYSCWTPSNSDICLINGDGTGKINLTNTPSLNERNADWSPDGRQIAFAITDKGQSAIYVMDADGSNPHRLTSGSAYEWYPAWSPDGAQIAFGSDQNVELLYEVYVMQSDGSAIRQLTGGPDYSLEPAWSPDGRQIAFNQRGQTDIAVINVDGSDLHNLTSDPEDDEAPAWSPDGNWIAFHSYRDGNPEVYLMRADGTQLTNLSNSPAAGDFNPDWRPSPVAARGMTSTQPLQPPLAQPAETTPSVTITATQVITYAPGPPTGEPREGSCDTSSLVVWREDAWHCTEGDPCFSADDSDDSVICVDSPISPTVSFELRLTEPLPAPVVHENPAGHAWWVELADGTLCGFATGATGGVGDERINYWCPSPDPELYVALLGDLKPGLVTMAHRAVFAGGMASLMILDWAEVPLRTVWR